MIERIVRIERIERMIERIERMERMIEGIVRIEERIERRVDMIERKEVEDIVGSFGISAYQYAEMAFIGNVIYIIE